MKCRIERALLASVCLVVASVTLCTLADESLGQSRVDRLEVHVFRRADHIEPMRGVEVFAAGADGTHKVGESNEHGIVMLSKEMIRAGSLDLLLFCTKIDSLNCNAIRVKEGKQTLLSGYHEVSVEIAGGISIVDRARVPKKR